MAATDTLLAEPASKNIHVGLYGTTEFSIDGGNPISVDVKAGFRMSSSGSTATKELYASFKASDKNGITLGQLIEACGGTSKDIPEILRSGIGFKSFGINYGSSAGSSKFEVELDTVITIDKTPIKATLVIKYEKTGGKGTFTFGGILKLKGGHRFDLAFSTASSASYLFASYRLKGETTIDLREIAATIFGGDVKEKMPEVSFKLDKFKAFILYRRQAGASSVLFGMGAGLELSLNDLPMAGPVIAKEKSFAFEEVLVMYSKGKFSKEELSTFPAIPQVEIAEGFNICSRLLINKASEYYMLSGGADEKYTEKPDEVKPATVDAIKGETSSKAKWTKIDKKLGPVHIQRLGFLYNKGKVVMLIDASMQMGAMGLQLVGLGIGFKLEWKLNTPEFYIDGLGLSYTQDPVIISGMFTRVDPKPQEFYSYYGAAQLSFSKFNISGIGAYSKLRDSNQVSMFIYAMYQGSIGGPAFFFVTGIAAGFGYNRKVRIPDITEVNTFPLVAMALNPVPAKTLNQVLAELIAKDCIPVSPGDYWLALGIKFTSFKIIESFALVIVQFGTHTEFTILGLSILAWPNKESPIAYIELALKAHFGTNSDVMSVEAMLTPNSYVLDKNCRITGGFAFYAWVSGEHEGDFVITLGGYHPKFVKPRHYPDVQRLGLNWKISNELQIKGGLYYALTPSCIMAGGRLEITYSLSFLRGCISVWADMLIAWAPYYYSVDIGISIRIEANIDMGLFYVRFNLEMGAQLQIWGPPFAGTVHVNWSIFAFTIPFGEAKVNKDYLGWEKFQKQFLSAKKDPVHASQGKDGQVEIYPAAEIMITAGIISETASYTIVNPHKLSIRLDAPIPITTATMNGAVLDDKTEMTTATGKSTYRDRNQNLGIRPMNERTLDSTFKISLSQETGFACSAYAAGVPEALWGPDKGNGSNNAPGDSKVLPNAMKGVVLTAREKRVPDGTPQFDLNGKFTVIEKGLTWTYVAARTGPDNDSYTVPIKKIIAESLEEQGKENSKRTNIIKSALAAQGLTESPDVSKSTHDWATWLTDDPVIVQVGGIPQFKDDK